MTLHITSRLAGSRPAIESRLTDFFTEQIRESMAYGKDFERLWQLASDTALRGKLVRPLLLVEIFDALAPDGSVCTRETLIDLAAAVELLHLSFLMHDDVIDGDLVRRGRPNLIGALLNESPVSGERPDASLHWAQTGGILMGDLLLSASYQVFARVDLPYPMRIRLLDLLDHSIIDSVAGEQADVGLADGIIQGDLGTILSMSRRKTATYTFELPLRAAAVLADCSPSTESTLTAVGRHLGLGFQLQDDLLSTFGEAEAHGKDRHSDLREGKQTAIIAFAQQTEIWPALAALIGSPDLTDDQARTIAQQLENCGAQAFVEGLVADQLRISRDLLEQAGDDMPAAARAVVLRLMSDLEGRNA